MSGFNVLDVAFRVAKALEHVGCPYFLGGSVASSLQGEARSTNDVDFVVAMTEPHIAPFVEALGPDFSVDSVGLRDAVRSRRSDNIFFLPVFTKIDLIVRGSSDYDLMEFSRRQPVRIDVDCDLMVKSPEDTILRKLRWFRDGGEVSSNQWRDVTQVLRVNEGRLDESYLDAWAPRIGIDDLLARARLEARSVGMTPR